MKHLNALQVENRIYDKIYSKIFFTNQRIQQYEAELRGDLLTKMDMEHVRKMLMSEENELQVYKEMMLITQLYNK
jgi:hypothetical protein